MPKIRSICAVTPFPRIPSAQAPRTGGTRPERLYFSLGTSQAAIERRDGAGLRPASIPAAGTARKITAKAASNMAQPVRIR